MGMSILILRIAVLYFDNRGKSEDLYFADGLTEEIISRLSRVENLSVVSKFDIAEFKGKLVDIDNITKKTNADFILSGNILRINDKIKIIMIFIPMAVIEILN